MNKKTIIITILGLLLISGIVNAQTEDSLPTVRTVPGQPFYLVSRFFENVGNFFTFGESNKARRYLSLAEKRLSETKILAEEQSEKVTEAVSNYEEQLKKAQEFMNRANEIDLQAEIIEATTRHLTAFDEVLSRIPEQAQENVKRAKEETMTGQIEALRGVAQQDPERATEILNIASEARLRAAQAKAESGEEDLEDNLEEYDKYAEFGKEISQMAEAMDKGQEVEALMERATEQHLQVLEDVKTKIPEQAQERINQAIQNAERVRSLPTTEDDDDQEESSLPDQAQEKEGSDNQEDSSLPDQAQENIPSSGQNKEDSSDSEEGGPPLDIPGGRP